MNLAVISVESGSGMAEFALALNINKHGGVTPHSVYWQNKKKGSVSKRKEKKLPTCVLPSREDTQTVALHWFEHV